MKIMTLILARNITINSKIIEQVGKIVRKHIPQKSFQSIGILLNSHDDTDESLAVAEIIKQITAPKKDKAQLINDPAFKSEDPAKMATGLLDWITHKTVIRNDFIIIIAKSSINYEPNQILSHMSESVIGKKFDFTPIFAV